MKKKRFTDNDESDLTDIESLDAKESESEIEVK